MEFSYGYDFNAFPLVVLTTNGKMTDDEETLNKFINDWGCLARQSSERNERHRLLIDVRMTPHVAFKCITHLVKTLVNDRLNIEKWMERTAVLVSSNVVEGLISAILAVYKPVRPFRVFRKCPKAISWLNSDDAVDIIADGNETAEESESESESETETNP